MTLTVQIAQCFQQHPTGKSSPAFQGPAPCWLRASWPPWELSGSALIRPAISSAIPELLRLPNKVAKCATSTDAISVLNLTARAFTSLPRKAFYGRAGLQLTICRSVPKANLTIRRCVRWLSSGSGLSGAAGKVATIQRRGLNPVKNPAKPPFKTAVKKT